MYLLILFDDMSIKDGWLMCGGEGGRLNILSWKAFLTSLPQQRPCDAPSTPQLKESGIEPNFSDRIDRILVCASMRFPLQSVT